jgi:hypothetical protein
MVFFQHLFGLPLLLTDGSALVHVATRWASMAWVPLGSILSLASLGLGGGGGGGVGVGLESLLVPPLAWRLLLFNIVCNAAATSALLGLVSSTNSLVASLAVPPPTLHRSHSACTLLTVACALWRVPCGVGRPLTLCLHSSHCGVCLDAYAPGDSLPYHLT